MSVDPLFKRPCDFNGNAWTPLLGSVGSNPTPSDGSCGRRLRLFIVRQIQSATRTSFCAVCRRPGQGLENDRYKRDTVTRAKQRVAHRVNLTFEGRMNNVD